MAGVSVKLGAMDLIGFYRVRLLVPQDANDQHLEVIVDRSDGEEHYRLSKTATLAEMLETLGAPEPINIPDRRITERRTT